MSCQACGNPEAQQRGPIRREFMGEEWVRSPGEPPGWISFPEVVCWSCWRAWVRAVVARAPLGSTAMQNIVAFTAHAL